MLSAELASSYTARGRRMPLFRISSHAAVHDTAGPSPRATSAPSRAGSLLFLRHCSHSRFLDFAPQDKLQHDYSDSFSCTIKRWIGPSG
jgi:hypothetical protein